MFIKGLKYEFRAVARIVMPMLIVLLAVAFLMSASFVLDGRVFHFSAALTETGTTEARELIAGLFMMLEMMLGMGLYFLIIAISIAVFALLVYRFYVSFFTDEGYLTFTLPLTIKQHLWIKLVSMLIWNILSIVAAGLAVLMILIGAEIGYGGVLPSASQIFDAYAQMFSMIGSEFGMNLLHTLLVILNLLAVTALQSVLIYFSIALGCMLVKKHRLIASIVTIFIVDGILSTVVSVVSFIMVFVSFAPASLFLILLIFTLLVTVAAMIGTYFGTIYILERKLNLD